MTPGNLELEWLVYELTIFCFKNNFMFVKRALDCKKKKFRIFDALDACRLFLKKEID